MNFEKIKRKFQSEFSKKKIVAIGHHVDADGLTSAAIISRWLNYKSKVAYFAVNNSQGCLEPEQTQEILGVGFQGVILADTAPREVDEINKLVKNGIYVAIVDHHGFLPTIKDCPNLFINSTDEGIPGQTASELSHLLVGDSHTHWLAQIGLCGDLKSGNYSSSTHQVADRLNLVGLAGKKGESLEERSDYCSGIIGLLRSSTCPKEFLNQFEVSSFKIRYEQVATQVNELVLSLKEQEKYTERLPKGNYSNKTTNIFNTGIYTVIEHRFFEGKFDLVEQVLKRHKPEMRPNSVVILYTGDEQQANVRLYISTKLDGLDCGLICRDYGGGGHPDRAGVRTIQTRNFEKVHQMTSEVIKALK